jgi:hypothetical protein
VTNLSFDNHWISSSEGCETYDLKHQERSVCRASRNSDPSEETPMGRSPRKYLQLELEFLNEPHASVAYALDTQSRGPFILGKRTYSA